jgi:hypothetical protein
MRAVRAPDRAAAAEASQPACPPPITTTSKCLSEVLERCDCRIGGELLLPLVVGDGCEASASANAEVEGPDAGRMAPELVRSLGDCSIHWRDLWGCWWNCRDIYCGAEESIFAAICHVDITPPAKFTFVISGSEAAEYLFDNNVIKTAGRITIFSTL